MLKLRKIKTKKAQVASTLTWIVGFIIIFFIMFIFTSLTLIIAKTKGISKKDVLIENKEGNLVLTNQLVSFLNTPVEIDGKNMKIKDLIIKVKDDKKYEEQMKKETQDFVKAINPECYVVKLYDSDTDELFSVSNFKEFSYWKKIGIRDVIAEDIFIEKKGGEINIPYKNEYIKLQAYLGDCNIKIGYKLG